MPHSILKKSKSTSGTASVPLPARSREDRNKETAIYHAELLQQRRNVEALVLASTETLLDIPSSPNADPAHPNQSDIVLVKDSLRLFQPSDYDALIEERNINDQCGYVLCPRSNRKQDTKARYRILHGRGEDSDALRFVSRQSLEQWCSDECGKRALYVKVQLNEEPAWTRVDSSAGDVELLENRDFSDGASALAQGMMKVDVGLAEDRIVQSMKALALERRDGDASSRSRGLAEVDVRERLSVYGVSSPESSIDASGGPHHSIEGYTPRFFGKDEEREGQ